MYINNFKRLSNSLEAKEINLLKRFLIALLLNILNRDYKYIVTIITQTIGIDNDSLDLDTIISLLLDKSRRVKSIKGKNSSSHNNIKNSTINYNYSTSSSSSDNNKNNNNKRNSIRSSYNNKDIEMSMSTTKRNNNNKSNNIDNIKTNNYCNKRGYLEPNCYNKNFNLIKSKSINNTRKELL